MTLKLYNTMSSKIELFKPRVKNKVTLYVCGPTVYDYSHIGHGKTYMAFDLITRYLEYKGYNVKYVVNDLLIRENYIHTILTNNIYQIQMV